MVLTVLVIDSRGGKKAESLNIGGDEPILGEGELISVHYTGYRIRNTSFPGKITNGSATAYCELRYTSPMPEPYISMQMHSHSLADARGLFEYVHQLVHGYKPLELKSAPPKPEDPSAWRMFVNFIDGFALDLLRLRCWFRRIRTP